MKAALPFTCGHYSTNDAVESYMESGVSTPRSAATHAMRVLLAEAGPETLEAFLRFIMGLFDETVQLEEMDEETASQAVSLRASGLRAFAATADVMLLKTIEGQLASELLSVETVASAVTGIIVPAAGASGCAVSSHLRAVALAILGKKRDTCASCHTYAPVQLEAHQQHVFDLMYPPPHTHCAHACRRLLFC